MRACFDPCRAAVRSFSANLIRWRAVLVAVVVQNVVERLLAHDSLQTYELEIFATMGGELDSHFEQRVRSALPRQVLQLGKVKVDNGKIKIAPRGVVDYAVEHGRRVAA